MLHIFRRKRVVLSQTHFVHGDIFTPGAMAYSPVATVADPPFESDVEPSRNFKTLLVTQPPMVFQNQVLPNGANPGDPYNVMDPNGLVSLDTAYGGEVRGDIYG